MGKQTTSKLINPHLYIYSRGITYLVHEKSQPVSHTSGWGSGSADQANIKLLPDPISVQDFVGQDVSKMPDSCVYCNLLRF
jgi:hypothetical protein